MKPLPPEGTRLELYSTPGLRRNELSRQAKKLHLASAYKSIGEDAKKILDTLYGETPDGKAPHTEAAVKEPQADAK